MSSFDYLESRADADELIQYFGMQASLRRSTDTPTDRSCWVAIVEYEPSDKSTSLANPTDRRVIMSADLGAVLAEPPDSEKDVLVTYVQPAANPPVINEILPFTCPVKPTAPAGIVVCYEFTVRR